ncbi:MAG TPA: hypothetical protein VK943_01460 [Arenibaculum sp.]|nr:hypothetical protein [Arenibaculum sp.]
MGLSDRIFETFRAALEVTSKVQTLTDNTEKLSARLTDLEVGVERRSARLETMMEMAMRGDVHGGTPRLPRNPDDRS